MMTYRNRLFVVCSCVLMAAANADAGNLPRVLEDAELDHVSAGNAAATSHRYEGSHPDGGPAPRSAVIAHEARTVLRHGARIDLDGNAQRGLQASSVVNAAAADAASAVNIQSTPIVSLAAQHNWVRQALPINMQLGGYTERNGARRHGEATSLRQSLKEAHAFQSITSDRSYAHTVETGAFQASVPGFSPARDFEVSLNLGTLPDIALPAFSFDWTAGSEPFKFGVAGSFSGLHIRGPTLSLGALRADGDDLIIGGGSISLPAPDLPDISGRLCAFTCWSGDIRGSQVGSKTTTSIDIGEIRLPGANPFKDLDLQLGHGIAAVGSGTFNIQGGSASVTATLSFGLPSIDGGLFSLEVIPSLGFMSSSELSEALKVLGAPPVRHLELGSLSMPSAEFSIELVDFTAPTLAGAFGFSGQMTDAVVCVSVVSTSCGQQTFQRSETRHRDDSEHSSSTHQLYMHEEWSRAAATEVRSPAELRDAEGGLLVISGSSADIGEYHLVRLQGNAQQYLRALNGANVATALVAGAANVARHGPLQAHPSALTQANMFIQGFTGAGAP